MHGFPLTVEKIEKTSETTVNVTGIVHWTQAVSRFKLKGVNRTIRIEKIPFKLTQTKDGNKVGIAQRETIPLSGIDELKLSLLGKYNVKLTPTAPVSVFGGSVQRIPLAIAKKQNVGQISGKMKIVDNSFNYPSSYLSFEKFGADFNLATLKDGKLNTEIDVISSAFTEEEASSSIYNKLDDYINEVSTRISIPENAPYNILENSESPLYYLCNSKSDSIKFQLIRFDATANPKNSFIAHSGKIHLDALIQAHIKDAKPENLKVHIPGVILDDNRVYPYKGADPIKVNLEEWELLVKDWSFSVEEGGITSNNASLHTKLLDMPVKQFVLRTDMFIMDSIQYSDLSMGGGKFKLSLKPGVKPQLNFEQKAGVDKKPHWVMSIAGRGNEAIAWLPEFNGLGISKGTGNYKVEVDYIQIISNNEMIFQMRQQENPAQLMGNSLAVFTPQSMYNGPDYISLSGPLNTGAPRFGNIGITARWDQPDKPPVFDSIYNLDVAAGGPVHFKVKKSPILINNRVIAISDGAISEEPSPTFTPLPAHFFCFNSPSPFYAIKVQKGHTTQLSGSTSSGYKLILTEGGMYAGASTDWSVCRFSGWMLPNSSSPSTASDLQPSFTEFKVIGDIITVTAEANLNASAGVGPDSKSVGVEAKASANIKVDVNKEEIFRQLEKNEDIARIKAEVEKVKDDLTTQYAEAKAEVTGVIADISEHKIGTPLGEMTQVFDFKTGRLLGSLVVKTPIVLGGMNIFRGTVETCVDRDGFYLAGGFYAFIPMGILSGNYNVGFMGGYYPLTDRLWNVTNTYIDKRVRNECYKQSTEKLLGFYAVFNREIVNFEKGFDFTVVSGYIRALGLVGGDAYFNLSNEGGRTQFKLGMGGYIYIDVGAGLSLGSVASLSGSLLGRGDVRMQVGTPFSEKSYFELMLRLDFEAQACVIALGCADV